MWWNNPTYFTCPSGTVPTENIWRPVQENLGRWLAELPDSNSQGGPVGLIRYQRSRVVTVQRLLLVWSCETLWRFTDLRKRKLLGCALRPSSHEEMLSISCSLRGLRACSSLFFPHTHKPVGSCGLCFPEGRWLVLWCSVQLETIQIGGSLDWTFLGSGCLSRFNSSHLANQPFLLSSIKEHLAVNANWSVSFCLFTASV